MFFFVFVSFVACSKKQILARPLGSKCNPQPVFFEVKLVVRRRRSLDQGALGLFVCGHPATRKWTYRFQSMREKSVSNIIKQAKRTWRILYKDGIWRSPQACKWTHGNRLQRLGLHGHCYKRRLVIARHVCRLLAAASRPVGH